jgi:hypothetical protein
MTCASDRETYFVVGSPKSGTTLVQSLLDGHDDLFVFLPEMRYFQHKGLPSIVHQHDGFGSVADYAVSAETDEIRRRILSHEELTGLRGEGETPRNIPRDRVDADGFFDDARSVAAETDAELITGLVDALARNSDYVDEDRTDELALVEKTPLQEEFAPTLDRWFSRAKFVHVVRNPYALVTSLRRRVQRGGRYPDVGRQVFEFPVASYYFMERNRRAIDDYHVLDYDGLLREPEPTVRALADFLDVPFTDSMTTPTIGTVPWAGNSMYDQSFEGISREPLDRWRDEISAFEIDLTNRLLGSVIDQYYPDQRLETEGTLAAFAPQEDETPTRYLANRLTYLRERLQ